MQIYSFPDVRNQENNKLISNENNVHLIDCVFFPLPFFDIIGKGLTAIVVPSINHSNDNMRSYFFALATHDVNANVV